MTTRAKPKWYLRGWFLGVAVPTVFVVTLAAAWWFAPMPALTGAIVNLPGVKIVDVDYSRDASQLLVVVMRTMEPRRTPRSPFDPLPAWFASLNDVRQAARVPALRGLVRNARRILLWDGTNLLLGPKFTDYWMAHWTWSEQEGAFVAVGPEMHWVFDVKTMRILARPNVHDSPGTAWLHSGMPSPDGRYIAFLASTTRRGATPAQSVGREGLILYQSDGSVARTVFDGFNWSGRPVWLPDSRGLLMNLESGTRVIGSAWTAGERTLYVVPTDSTKPVVPVVSPEDRRQPGGQPSFDPGGHRVAVTMRSSVYPPQLMIGDTKTWHFQKVADLPEGATEPVWSPRGDWLAFIRLPSAVGARGAGLSPQLMLITPDGKTKQMHGIEADFLVWHPSGEKLIAARGGALFEVAVPPAPLEN